MKWRIHYEDGFFDVVGKTIEIVSNKALIQVKKLGWDNYNKLWAEPLED